MMGSVQSLQVFSNMDIYHQHSYTHSRIVCGRGRSAESKTTIKLLKFLHFLRSQFPSTQNFKRLFKNSKQSRCLEERYTGTSEGCLDEVVVSGVHSGQGGADTAACRECVGVRHTSKRRKKCEGKGIRGDGIWDEGMRNKGWWDKGRGMMDKGFEVKYKSWRAGGCEIWKNSRKILRRSINDNSWQAAAILCHLKYRLISIPIFPMNSRARLAGIGLDSTNNLQYNLI